MKRCKSLWAIVLILVLLLPSLTISARDLSNETAREVPLKSTNETSEESSKESVKAATGSTKSVKLQIPANLNAKAALLMDASNGRVLFEKKGYDQLPMASTTKIMTCLYTLENGNLEDMVTISKRAANQPKVRLGMQEGQKYRLKDLLYALMLESYNDCAVAIAEHISGSVEQFCYDMTNRARDLGAFHTNFETPNGLDSEKHYTTCYDLALITKFALNNKQFIQITNTQSHTFQEQIKGTTHSVSNKDAFLTMYDGAIGVKTGFTGNAGYCFVGAVKKEDRTLISVVLACGWPPNKTYKWQDTTKLMNYGVKSYQLQEVLNHNIALTPIPVTRGIGNQTALAVRDDISLLMNSSETARIEKELPVTLPAPIHAGTVAGYLSIYIDDQLYRQVPVYTTNTIEQITYPYILKNILTRFLAAAAPQELLKSLPSSFSFRTFMLK